MTASMAATCSGAASSHRTARIVSVPFDSLPDGVAEGLAAAELAGALELGAAEVLAASSDPLEQAARARPATATPARRRAM
jgi:hypothetical protein